uniref:Uncharacterized protein n=1 Tax=Rhipicephalus microplus TaxID=6941 RepID=A0A6M2DAY7_RHIMP
MHVIALCFVIAAFSSKVVNSVVTENYFFLCWLFLLFTLLTLPIAFVHLRIIISAANRRMYNAGSRVLSRRMERQAVGYSWYLASQLMRRHV